MMTKLNLTFLLISLIQFCQAADNYSVGDSLYIWSKDGLSLKEAPNDSSESIKLLEGGEVVVVIRKTNIPKQVNLLGTKNHTNYESGQAITIRGYWILVETGGKAGYVFDSFLLNIPTYNQRLYGKFLRAATGKSIRTENGEVRDDIRFS